MIQENGLANYFETISAVAELVKCGNIEYLDNRQEMVQITKNGKLIASQLHTTLSLSVRRKAVGAIMRLMEKKKLERENPVTVVKAQGGGYNVNFRITDGMRDLMSLTLFVPDMAEVNAVKSHFYQYPDKVYSAVLAALTGDNRMLHEALRGMEP